MRRHGGGCWQDGRCWRRAAHCARGRSGEHSQGYQDGQQEDNNKHKDTHATSTRTSTTPTAPRGIKTRRPLKRRTGLAIQIQSGWIRIGRTGGQPQRRIHQGGQQYRGWILQRILQIGLGAFDGKLAQPKRSPRCRVWRWIGLDGSRGKLGWQRRRPTHTVVGRKPV